MLTFAGLTFADSDFLTDNFSVFTFAFCDISTDMLPIWYIHYGYMVYSTNVHSLVISLLRRIHRDGPFVQDTEGEARGGP